MTSNGADDGDTSPQQTDQRWHLPAASRDQPINLYHCKVNVDFRSVPVFAADVSFGAVLMTNGNGGRMLIPEILSATFDAFGRRRSGRRTEATVGGGV
jgi:hypothetical protein